MSGYNGSADHRSANHRSANHLNANDERPDHQRIDHEWANHERANDERPDLQRIDHECAHSGNDHSFSNDDGRNHLDYESRDHNVCSGDCRFSLWRRTHGCSAGSCDSRVGGFTEFANLILHVASVSSENVPNVYSYRSSDSC